MSKALEKKTHANTTCSSSPNGREACPGMIQAGGDPGFEKTGFPIKALGNDDSKMTSFPKSSVGNPGVSIRRFKPYPAYKDSGVEWLGKVPEKWTVVQFKQFVDIQNGVDHKQVEQDEGYPVLGSGGIFTYASDYLYDGESVLLGRKGTIDKPLHIIGRFWTVDTMYWTKIRPNTSGRFTYYSALTIPFDYYSTNTALPSMTRGALNNHLIARPPLIEQIQIAAFLDRETTRIDQLIARKERQIELLQEKRSALISHAVTKGLNPGAKMNDSGIEWLGEIPEHWEVKKLKRLVKEMIAGPFGSSLTKDMYVKEGYRVYGQEQVIPNDFSVGDYYITEDKYLEMKRYAVSPGDVLVSCVGTFGKIAVFPGEAEPGIINPRLIKIAPEFDKIMPDYLGLMLKSPVSFAQMDSISRGGTMDVMNIGLLSTLTMPVPPIDEQAAIHTEVSRRENYIKIVTDKVETSIDKLREYRTALISAAVTGKIDVRDEVA